MKYSIIIAGGREFNNFDIGLKCFQDFIKVRTRTKPTIICGMARGADMIGYQIAQFYKLQLEKFPANWDLYGKRAGYIRNEQMAKKASELGNGVLLAFWDGKSHGTKHMIDLAKKYNLEVHIYDFNGEEQI